MMTAMTSIENMIDVNTIIGDIVTSPDGTTIIPVSKVCFGFAAGGSEFNSTKGQKMMDIDKLPFGGGSGAGVNISPMGFLVVKDGNTKLLTLNGTTTAVDKLIDLMPDVINKVNNFVERSVEKPGKVVASRRKQEKSPDDFDEDNDEE